MRANFLFEKGVLSKLALFVCSFYTRHFLSLEEPGLSIWTRQIVLSLDVRFIYLMSRLLIQSPNKHY